MMSLLGMGPAPPGGGLNEFFAQGFGGDMRSGRMGDYAFNQAGTFGFINFIEWIA